MSSASDLQSSLGFKSRSNDYLDLFHGSAEFKFSATLVNSQLVCRRPAGIPSNVSMFNKQLLDEVFVISRIIKVEVRVISRTEG